MFILTNNAWNQRLSWIMPLLTCYKLPLLQHSLNINYVFHKTNPSSIPQGYVDSYSTLGHMGGGNRCGGILWWELLWHTLANRALASTHSTVESIMLMAAHHWGRDYSVVSDPLGEPACTPLYVGLHYMGLHGWWPYVLPIFCGRAP